ncbi:hypothetical protein QL285_060426 [Trifolium repens]|nr:hypothetical protein QL285_060426 [Trifolium repens]
MLEVVNWQFLPDACLLVQTGKQIEWLTAGSFKAVMQEVTVTDRTINSLTEAKELHRSLWGISLPLYVQLAPDAVLKPLKSFADSLLADDYSPTRAWNIGAGIND